VLLAIGDRVQPQQRRLLVGIEVAHPHAQAPVDVGVSAHRDRAGGVGVASRCRGLDPGPRAPERHVVGVRVQDHDPQVGLEQQPLEHDAERVGLPRPRLPAQERVAPEPFGIELERHPRRQCELADLEARAARSGARQPFADLLGRRRTRERVVEGAPVAVEDRADAAGEPDEHACLGAHVGVAVLDRGRLLVDEPQRVHLPEPPAGDVLEDDIASDAQVELVQPGLERERAPVDRGRERQHRGLDRRAQGAVLGGALLEVGHDATLGSPRVSRRHPRRVKLQAPGRAATARPPGRRCGSRTPSTPRRTASARSPGP
jgi:hypothetical protein